MVVRTALYVYLKSNTGLKREIVTVTEAADCNVFIRGNRLLVYTAVLQESV